MKNTVTTLLALSLVAAFASASLASAACPTCDAATKLTKELKALNYASEADRSKGGLLALDAVKTFEQATKLPKKDARSKAFSSALPMVREAAPYDGESQLAELLAATIKADAKLKAEYEGYMKSLPKKTAANKADACKTEQLKASVDEVLCRMGAGVKGQDPASAKMQADAKSCIRPFNFEECSKN